MMPHWTTYLSAFSVPAVAALGLLIAYRQWRTAQNKLKLDLLDRRLIVYEVVRGYITSVMASGKTMQEEEVEFFIGTRGAKWIFGDEITKYLDGEFHSKTCRLKYLQDELSGMPIGETRTKIANEIADLRKWFFAQYKISDEKFAPYLTLRH